MHRHSGRRVRLASARGCAAAGAAPAWTRALTLTFARRTSLDAGATPQPPMPPAHTSGASFAATPAARPAAAGWAHPPAHGWPRPTCSWQRGAAGWAPTTCRPRCRGPAGREVGGHPRQGGDGHARGAQGHADDAAHQALSQRVPMAAVQGRAGCLAKGRPCPERRRQPCCSDHGRPTPPHPTWLTNIASSAAANDSEKAAKLPAAQKAAIASSEPAAMPAAQSSRALRIEAPTASSRAPPASVPSTPAAAGRRSQLCVCSEGQARQSAALFFPAPPSV